MIHHYKCHVTLMYSDSKNPFYTNPKCGVRGALPYSVGIPVSFGGVIHSTYPWLQYCSLGHVIWATGCITPSQVIQPHIMREPPTNFRVLFTSLSLRHSPSPFHAHLCPSDPRQLILVSSDHMTFFQSSIVQSL